MAEDALERDVTSEGTEDAMLETVAEEPVAVAEPELPAGDPAPTEPPAEESAAIEVPAEELEPQSRPRSPLPWWPYLVLGIAWAALWGAQTYVLTRTPDVPVVNNEAYPVFLLIGLFLVLLGPLSSLIVWLAVRDRATMEQRHGLYTRSLFRSSVMTLIGAGGWAVFIVAVDALRLGLIRI